MSGVLRGRAHIELVSIRHNTLTLRQGSRQLVLMGEGRMIAEAIDAIFPGDGPVTGLRVGYRRSGNMLLSLHEVKS